MSADALLPRFDGVRKSPSRPGCWRATCPHCGEKSAAVRELADGRVLLHCFVGCSVEQVLGAVGLGLDALFPERPAGERMPRERRPFPAADVLAAVADEALIAAVLASSAAQGDTLADDERARLWTAAGRLAAAVEVAHGC